MALIQLRALNGHSLNVETSGNGPAVLAIHGFTGSLHTWDYFVEAAGAEFRVLCVDILGHGASDAPAEARLYDMEHTVAALDELLDHLSLPAVNWLGYSMGGRIALACALNLPERTTSLVVESASPGIADSRERELRRRSDAALAARLENEGIENFVRYWESLPMWQSQSRLPSNVRAALHQQRVKNNATGLARSLRGIGTGAQPPLWGRLSELHVSALILAGAEDSKFKAIAQKMHSMIPQSRSEIVPEAGHSIHLEQPAVFNRAVLEFLRQVSPPAPGPQALSGTRLQGKGAAR